MHNIIICMSDVLYMSIEKYIRSKASVVVLLHHTITRKQASRVLQVLQHPVLLSLHGNIIFQCVLRLMVNIISTSSSEILQL